jgi:hypothetical protein
MLKVPGSAVCHTSLEVCPDKLVRVKLRGVSREVKGVDSVKSSKEFLDKPCPVNRASVPEKDNRFSEFAAKSLKELPDLPGSDISIGIKAGVKSKTLSLGRDGDCGDSRDFGPASGDDNRGRLSSDRPGSLDVGNKRESALIQEGQAGSKPIGLFLYGARRDTSSSGSILPGALWLSSLEPDNSSPAHPSDSKGCLYNIALESASGSPGRYASRSKDRSYNRLPEALSPRRAPKTSSGCPTKAKDAPYWGLASTHSDPSSDRIDASAPRSLKKNGVPWLPNDRFGLVSTSGSPDDVAFPRFGGCHEVS